MPGLIGRAAHGPPDPVYRLAHGRSDAMNEKSRAKTEVAEHPIEKCRHVTLRCREVTMMRRGFTLIELLVVIAIIAILAAILFPVFARAREKARQSSCLSNVRQMSNATMMYLQDYDERFPGGLIVTNGTAQGPVSQSSYFTAYWLTADLIHPYVKNREIFFCPSGDKGSVYSCDYGFNRRLCPDMRPAGTQGILLGDIKAPAELFLCLDSGCYMVSESNITAASGSFWYVPGTWDPVRDPEGDGYNTTYPLTGKVQTDYKIGRHNKGCNVGFADGHAKWLAGDYIRGNLQHWYP